MSGPDNLKGIDYQLSYTVLELLLLLRDPANRVRSIRFDSLTDDEEDLTIEHESGEKTLVQIKKKTEGYQWTPSTLRPVLQRFHEKYQANVRYVFVTDRGVSLDVAKLKRVLRAEELATDVLLDKFTGPALVRAALDRLLPVLTIRSDYYASPDPSDPARTLRDQIAAVLLSRPFLVEAPVDDVIRLLWDFAFNSAKAGALVTYAEIAQVLKRSGVSRVDLDWSSFPNVNDYIGRVAELAELLQLAESSRRIVVHGMSGTGKTVLLGRLADAFWNRSHNVLWISVNPLTSPIAIVRRFSAFFLDRLAVNPMADVNPEDLPAAVDAWIAALVRHAVFVIVDDVNRASPLTRSFIEAVLAAAVGAPLCSTLLVSSNETDALVDESAIDRGLVHEFTVGGYCVADARAFVEKFAIPLPPEVADDFHSAVGGHPMSYVLLREICNSSLADAGTLIRQGLGRMQQWLREHVLRSMGEGEQRALRLLSVYTYPFDDTEAELVLDSDRSARHAIAGLSRRDLISRTGDTYVLHDVVRATAYDQLAPRVRTNLHARCSIEYMTRIEAQTSSNRPVAEDLSIKWMLHTMLAVGEPCQTPVVRALLERTRVELDVLWAIQRFNYPFSFSFVDGEEDEQSLLARLTGAGLIRARPSTVEDLPPETLMYDLVSDDYASLLFLHEFCRMHGISGAMGYIPIFEENWNFPEQNRVCQWEHCIELQPCPPLTRAEQQEHYDFIRNGFADGRYDNAEPWRLEVLQSIVERGVPDNAPEKRDVEIWAAACPLFAHICPGGRVQAAICAAEIAELDETEEEPSA